MKIEEVSIGQRVKWNDPDGGICSGLGTVIGLREGGIVNLRKDDGGEAEVLAHEIAPVEEYTVSMRVDGRVNVIVEASSFEEAFELAEEAEYDPTEVECIEYEPVNATDSRGMLKDYH